MGVYANGQIIYGFVNTDEIEDLFDAIEEKRTEEEENDSFGDLHYELQKEHGVSLDSVGYACIDILCAFSASASSKGFASDSIKSKHLTKTKDYDARIRAFLEALDINADLYTPGWHILGYMS